MKKLYLIPLLLISNISVFAEDFYGKIVKDGISETTVILIELDIIEISDEDGKFAFYGVRPGEYTLKVITPEEEMDFSITVNAGQDNSNTPELFEIINIAGDAVEEEIIITAEKDIQQEPNITDYSPEFINDVPLVDKDPFNIIANEAGVHTEQRQQGSPFTDNVFIDNVDLSLGNFFTYGIGYSVYGGDSSWNQSYLDFLPVPTNIHLSDNSKSVITKESIGRIRTIKGPPPGRYGQALGGTVIVYPKEVINNRLDLGLSITDPYVGYSTKIGKNLSMFTIARQSISQYTVFPIVNMLMEQSTNSAKTDVRAYLFGDWLFSLKYDKGDEILKILTLAYYDRIDANSKLDTKTRKFHVEINHLPYFFGGGFQWRKVVAQKGLNVLDITSYYSTSTLDYDANGSTNEDTNLIKKMQTQYTANSDVWTISLREAFSWALTNTHLLSFGTSLEYSTLNANYEDTYIYNDTTLKSSDRKAVDDKLPKYTVDETIFRAYAYTQYDYEDYFDRGNIKLSFSPGVSWIQEKPTKVYPSLRGEFATTFNDIHTLSLAVGWSPAFLEKMQYIDRKILEKTIDYSEGETNYTNPSYGVMLSTKYLITLGNHQLSVTPYFGWYYNFNGVFSQFRYNEPNSNRGYYYKPVSKGFGAGTALRWKYTVGRHVLDISYNLGFTYFDTEDDGWLPTVADIRHTINLTYLLNVHKAVNFSLVGLVEFDKPFTPTKITLNKAGEPLTSDGNLNSARSYIPAFRLIPSFTGDFVDNKRITLSYRFALGDLLAFINYKETGPKDTSSTGSSNKDINNRKIDYELDMNKFAKEIELAVYIRFKL